MIKRRSVLLFKECRTALLNAWDSLSQLREGEGKVKNKLVRNIEIVE